jgi:ribose transport system substrate-binding protein
MGRIGGLIAMAAALACLVAIGACGSDDNGAGGGGGEKGRYKKEITIGWTPPDITGVFKTATDFFERSAAEANKAGFKVKVLSRSPATHTAFADQLAIIENYVSKKVDVIAISPADTQAVKPAIKQANQAGIPVIMVNLLEPQKEIEVASYIGFDNSEAASVSAYNVLDYYGGPGVTGTGKKLDPAPDEYLDLDWWKQAYGDADKDAIKARGSIIEGIAGTFFSQERVDGFNEVMKDYPGIQIQGKPIAADWNREKGVKAAENFLSRYGPGELDFLWAASNEMGLGAINATKRRGRLDDSGGKTPPEKGKVAIFTNDVTPESTDAIRQGELIAETHHGFPEWGWFGTEYAVKLACGQKVPQTKDIRPRTVWQGNADQFYPEPKLPKIDWQKIKADC